jgi:putative transcriptional regulator
MIIVDIEVVLAKLNSARTVAALPRLTRGELAERIDIAPENLSRLSRGHFSAVRRTTLDALCRELSCQPGDLLRYVADVADSPTHDAGDE